MRGLNGGPMSLRASFVLIGVASLGAFAWLASCGGSESNEGSGGNSTGIFSTGAASCAEQCQSGLCDPQRGCVECNVNGDCHDPGQPICVGGHCEECGANADCGTGQSCFPGNNECHTACTSNANCTDGNANICDT